MAKKNARSLVVVESPAKARTISRILGADYDVKASIGHIRDLPKHELGIDVDDDFKLKYVVPKEKQATVTEIKNAAQKADEIYLATDPDREGEAIAWHLKEAAGLDGGNVRRVVFHEITPEAVRAAFDHPREIDMKLVDAQQGRRVVDRLVGYRISPFLWKKVRRGLSAGRVQSVAVRLVAEREREILGFKPQEYWTIDIELEKPAATPSFKAKLQGYVGKKGKIEIGNETDAQRHVAGLRSSAYSVLEINTKTTIRRPSAPFITSTLQQEASRRLGWAARRTMQVAQALYEGLPLGPEGEVGLITYMRTDSTNVAQSAINETRDYISKRYGPQFVPASQRVYTKKVKGAQEAHEAIRPTSTLREPDAIKRYLKDDQFRLYNLIWQRMVASQMADALFDVTTVDIEAKQPQPGDPYLVRASNTLLKFPGFRQVYEEGKDEGEEEEAVGNNPLPALSQSDPLNLLQVLPDQHFTEPPSRYTEASLVKALEEKGIGRPSTYAPTMTTIQERGYVEKEQRFLKPTDLGLVVNDLLVDHFPDFVDVDFTAQMEDELDEVADGDRRWQPVVKEFYDPLEEALKIAQEAAKKQVQETEEKCQECGKPMVIRWGRRGRFLACTGFPECKGTRSLEGEDSAAETPQATDEKCPECESPMVIKSGRFGKFIACTRYPECKGRKPLAKTTGVKCPTDGGDLLERRTKKGRTFYGCANYPKCDFTTWNRPLAEPCPSCGKLITAERDGKAKCTACEWKGEAPVASITIEAQSAAPSTGPNGNAVTHTQGRTDPAPLETPVPTATEDDEGARALPRAPRPDPVSASSKGRSGTTPPPKPNPYKISRGSPAGTSSKEQGKTTPVPGYKRDPARRFGDDDTP